MREIALGARALKRPFLVWRDLQFARSPWAVGVLEQILRYQWGGSAKQDGGSGGSVDFLQFQ